MEVMHCRPQPCETLNQRLARAPLSSKDSVRLLGGDHEQERGPSYRFWARQNRFHRIVEALLSFSEGDFKRVWDPHLFMRVSRPVFEKPGITPVFF